MNYLTKGIDISSNNGTVNFEKVKAAGINFVMIRCGFGNDVKNQDDNQFERNVAECERLKIPWGSYFFSYALNTTDAKSEVQHALRLLKNKKPTYPIAFDMEDADGYKSKNGMPSSATLVSICQTFLAALEANKYYVSLYASLSWLNNQLNSSKLNPYDKWVAQWSSSCVAKFSYGMWQYGGETNYIDSPYLSGINGMVDKNYAYYDFPTIIKNAGLNGWEKPKILGDVDNDGALTVKDTTLIQKHIAKIKPLTADQISRADFDKNGVVDIKDVTAIQKKIATQK